ADRPSTLMLLQLGHYHRVPAKTLLKPAEDRLRDPAEIPNVLIFVLDVLRDDVRENVVLVHLRDLKAVLAEELLEVFERVAEGDRAAFLRLGITRRKLAHLPELELTVGHHDPQDLPAPLRIHHDADF